MNVYDFDNTIFRGDSTARFYLYCLKKTPKMLRRLPCLAANALLFALHVRDKTLFKERMYAFLKDVRDVDGTVQAFWQENAARIQPWYLQQAKASDVIISASPEFLLQPMARRLGVYRLIASQVDRHTGRYSGINCHGAEKVRRFETELPGFVITNFYSDSYSDSPLAHRAENAFIVQNGSIFPWPKNR